mmetsp:Transcript_1398/g.3104  ORF Transcript_1398/g.3104 Transcript_1398/m.3104 type:complete len:346 (+) Transcript_1398:388-1425(+)
MPQCGAGGTSPATSSSLRRRRCCRQCPPWSTASPEGPSPLGRALLPWDGASRVPESRRCSHWGRRLGFCQGCCWSLHQRNCRGYREPGLHQWRPLKASASELWAPGQRWSTPSGPAPHRARTGRRLRRGHWTRWGPAPAQQGSVAARGRSCHVPLRPIALLLLLLPAGPPGPARRDVQLDSWKTCSSLAGDSPAQRQCQRRCSSLLRRWPEACRRVWRRSPTTRSSAPQHPGGAQLLPPLQLLPQLAQRPLRGWWRPRPEPEAESPAPVAVARAPCQGQAPTGSWLAAAWAVARNPTCRRGGASPHRRWRSPWPWGCILANPRSGRRPPSTKSARSRGLWRCRYP